MLELRDVTFDFQGGRGNTTRIFDSLNLVVTRGERIGIMGDEGVGKTTLLQLMAGLLKPASGNVLLDSGLHFGFAFQFPEQQFIRETVEEEILMTSRALKLPPVSPMIVLRRFGFVDESILERSPYSLSLGEARRVAIASIIASNPPVVFLDEPTVGLDMEGTNQVLAALEQIGKDVTLITSSHDSNFLSEIVDRVVVLGPGSVLVDGHADMFCNTEHVSELGLQVPEVVQYAQAARLKGLKISGTIRRRRELISALQGKR